MRKILLLTLYTALAVIMGSCKKDDDSAPVVVVPNLELTASVQEVQVGTEVSFTVTADKKPVENVFVQLIGGEQIKNYKWTPTKEGSFKFKATKEGYQESKEITIKVNPFTPKNEANVSYLDKNIKLDATLLQLDAIEWEDDKTKEKMISAWSFMGINEELGKVFFVFFNTPTKDLGNNKYDYTLPNATNVSDVFIIALQKDADGTVTTEGMAFEDIKTSFKMDETQPFKDYLKGEIEISTPNLGGKSFKLVSKGDHVLITELKAKATSFKNSYRVK